MNKTRIEYLDYTLNLEVGCSGIGCAVRAHCWACSQAKRQKHRCLLCYRFIPHWHMERLEEPSHVKKPSRIGLNFMGETFDKVLTDVYANPSFFLQMINMILANPQHHFIIFTKQPQNIPHITLPPNLSIGVSVNRKEDLWRFDELRKINCECRIVSFEPMYEHIDADLGGIDWIIIGAQKKPEFQPKQEWVRVLIEAARLHGSCVFLKNNLRLSNIVPSQIQEYPKQLIVKEESLSNSLKSLNS